MRLRWAWSSPTRLGGISTRLGTILRCVLVCVATCSLLILLQGDADAGDITDRPLCGHEPHEKDAVIAVGSARPSLENAQAADQRIASRAEVMPLTNAHLYAGYTKEDLTRITGSDPSDVAYLHPLAARAFLAMKRAGEAEGFGFQIGSAWRPWDRQLRAYEQFRRTGLNLNGDPVPNISHPCNSKHPAGLAVDLNVHPGGAFHRWLLENASAFGFKNTRDDEPWEWQFVGLILPVGHLAI